jgi:hypothetical protein
MCPGVKTTERDKHSTSWGGVRVPKYSTVSLEIPRGALDNPSHALVSNRQIRDVSGPS